MHEQKKVEKASKKKNIKNARTKERKKPSLRAGYGGTATQFLEIHHLPFIGSKKLRPFIFNEQLPFHDTVAINVDQSFHLQNFC